MSLASGALAQWNDPGARVVHRVHHTADGMVVMDCGAQYSQVVPPTWVENRCRKCFPEIQPTDPDESE